MRVTTYNSLALFLALAACSSSTNTTTTSSGTTTAGTTGAASTTGGTTTAAGTTGTTATGTTGTTATGTTGTTATAGTTSAGTTGSELLATGQTITPTAAPGSTFQPLNPGLTDFPSYTVGQAVTTVVSPDGNTLLVLTSGYNQQYSDAGSFLPEDSMEYVFVFDISATTPVQKQVIKVPNTYMGIAFSPDGTQFYVGGGIDDNVHGYEQTAGTWTELSGVDGGPLAKLNHVCGNTFVAPGAFPGAGQVCAQSLQPPGTAGLAVSADGLKLVIANHENDSISVVALPGGVSVTELDLRPGKSNVANAGVPGGEYPYWVSIKGSSTAYVSSLRDREVVVVNLTGTPSVTTRIPVSGNPNKMILNAAQSQLFVACDNSDLVTVIDTTSNTVTKTISTAAPPGTFPAGDEYPGASPNSLALSADENTLYVTNGALNSVAVINLAGSPPAVVGLIPTGWYPNSVSVGNAGGMLYVVNGKNIPGPNPCNSHLSATCTDENQYVLQLEKAGFLTLPVPSTAQLATLTATAVANSALGAAPNSDDQTLFATLRQNIKHVIYIVKENRTFDQVLGDLAQGNGDPSLTEYPQATTPNLHALATTFVTLDNFYDPGEVSMNGWPWSTGARELDIGVKSTPVNYAGRGYSYDEEGQARLVNVGISSDAARLVANPLMMFNPDPDLLPGIANPAAPDSPPNASNAFDGGYQQGHLWDSALRAGLTVRNYGMFIDEVRYSSSTQSFGVYIPPYTDPSTTDGGTTVAYVSDPALVALTDPYFRGFDNVFPDFYRETEWEREFNGFVDAGTLPNLELVRLMHDHTGNFSDAVNGVNTPELQQADNDYAVGKLVQKIAASPYAGSTLIFVVEDDAQDGPDHVDAHRSIAFIAGPYVKQGAVVSTHYSTVNMLRTIEDVLGIAHLGVFDAYQRPMSDVFDTSKTTWSFSATPSALLSSTTLPITTAMLDRHLHKSRFLKPTHQNTYWADAMKSFDFSVEDHLDAARYNRILWKGLMGDRPYPTLRDGRDLRLNRDALLKKARKKNRLLVADARPSAVADGR
jgi:YVTN family beta-propeller protein